MPGKENFPASGVHFLRQMDAAYHISIGDNATARVLLEGAVHITPFIGKSRDGGFIANFSTQRRLARLRKTPPA